LNAGRCRVRDGYVLTNWKRRSAFVVFLGGAGLWEAHFLHGPLWLGGVAGIAVALLKIWLEAPGHKAHD
jgi:hypothetical protein